MCKMQDQRVFKEDEAEKYLPEKSKVHRDLLVGPYEKQSVFSLAPGASLHLEGTWGNASPKEQGNRSAVKFRNQKQG